MVQSVSPFRTTPLLEKLAAFTERRQDVLAGNMANISTPGYKTRDLPVADFQEALKRSIEQQTVPGASRVESLLGSSADATDMVSAFPDELFRPIERPSRDLTFQDGNNRNIEAEVMDMTKNSLVQNFAIELLAAQFNLMQAVISEKP